MKKGIVVLFLLMAIAMTACERQSESVPETEISLRDEAFVEEHADDETMNMQVELANLERKEQSLYDEMNAREQITQLDMNMTSAEVYQLWDDELNAIWDLLKETLPGTEFEKLKNEQIEWIQKKEARLDELREIETGSAGPTIINDEASQMTKERVYRLVECLGE